MTSADESQELLIDLKNIERRFGQLTALRDVTIQMPRGRIGLLGPNGAGKSTLLKILMGLLPPSSGGGTVLGRDIRTSGVWIRQNLGYMSEADSLIPGTKGADYVALAGQLCGMSRKESQRRAHEILSSLGLGESRYRPLENYSTGMKQRIKLAQALVHDPEMLFLDEPTSGLDPSGRDAMLRLLLDLGTTHGKSYILSTHLLGDVERICDSLIILLQGEVLLAGKVADLQLKRQNRHRLKVSGNPSGFVTKLRHHEIEILADNGKGSFTVVAPTSCSPRIYFEIAKECGALVRELVQDDEDLEAMFHRVVRERSSNASST